jgi:uncharacterized membrane protein
VNNRALILALIVSATLNVFAVAAGVTVLIARDKVEQRVEAQNRPPRGGNSPRQLINRLDESQRERVHDALRASALAARPDFEEARRARREAVALASAPTYEPTQVKALLDQSRAAEMRGRARLEADVLTVLPTLDVEDRQILAQILSRRPRSRDRQADTHAAPPSSRR